MRRTKILATLGPASENKEVLRKMIQAGLNAVRCNFSHGDAQDHAQRVEFIRTVAREEGRTIGILGDLQGPKIRVAKFKQGSVMLEHGAEFVIDSALGETDGDAHQVGTDYEDLARDLNAGDILLLDDGNISLKVNSVAASKVICSVLDGGKLSNNKGINKLGGGLSAPALTDKDKADIKTAAALGMDYVAVSFPRDAKDMELAKQLLTQAGSNAGVVAKIERVEAVANIDEIIRASDAVMVARGDLAVEVEPERVPGIQKMIIQRARELDKVAITATQMMESMIDHPVPTRAEVSDVANAVLDCTDVVMLSAETAVGKYPDRVIKSMDKICLAAEADPSMVTSGHRVELRFDRVDEAIAMATMYTANHLDVKAILALTESGSSALWMSRIKSNIPIFALTRNADTMGRCTLYRGVTPIHFDSTKMSKDDVNPAAAQKLVKIGLVQNGDLVLLTSGDHMGTRGGTNKMKVLCIGSVT
jgi:pyruvate kinase